MSLSDKEIETDCSTGERLHYARAYLFEDVKEFIKELKENKEIDGLDLEFAPHKKTFLDIIDELAGDKLK